MRHVITRKVGTPISCPFFLLFPLGNKGVLVSLKNICVQGNTCLTQSRQTDKSQHPGSEFPLKFYPEMDIVYLNNIPLAYLYFSFNSFGYNLPRTSSVKASLNNFFGISLINVYQSYVDNSLQKIDFLSRNGNVSILPIMRSYNWFSSTFLSQKAFDNNFFLSSGVNCFILILFYAPC